MDNLTHRIENLDWTAIAAALDERGYATAPGLLTGTECAELIAIYDDERRFRKRVVMERLGFGMGEYRYFAAPLPRAVQTMRAAFYPRLAPIANRWANQLRAAQLFPPALKGLLALCGEHCQTRPTPLLLRYEAGGFNCLHQDLYGEVAFPLQVTCVLSRPGRDYSGGEFLLVEQRPRSQSRGEAIALEQGAAIIFPNRHRPVRGTRGYYRVNVRHGVSRIHRGLRLSLGVIFHDAR
jgi:uncharacterized protein